MLSDWTSTHANKSRRALYDAIALAVCGVPVIRDGEANDPRLSSDEHVQEGQVQQMENLSSLNGMENHNGRRTDCQPGNFRWHS